MKLGFGFTAGDLYSHERLKKLFEIFLSSLEKKNQELYIAYTQSLTLKQENDKTLMQIALFTQEFLLEFFNIKNDFVKLQQQNSIFELIKTTQKNFINKHVKLYQQEELEKLNVSKVKAELLQFLKIESFNQFVYAQKIQEWLQNKENFLKELSVACSYGAYAMFTEEGIKEHKDDFIFFKAKKIDFDNLVIAEEQIADFNSYTISKSCSSIVRHDFSLHDKNNNLIEAVFQSNYCVHCHFRNRDYCSKGTLDKEGDLKLNPLGNKLAGCPLNMHISQMHYLNSQHNVLAAFAVTLINNPMVAGTGHRICNDCASSCIYQKQEPVDTPKAESIILKQVLNLPFGFELYSLLTRWNPCNVSNPYMKAKSGKKVLVVGAGPAGYTLSHYLLMQGHEVLCIDGNKIENLPNELANKEGKINALADIKEVIKPLQNRVIYGFGGVSEYGITARWDKNYLTVIRIILARNTNFKLLGGCSFGANITYSNAKELGFDHIAFCTGAGKSSTLNLENSLVNGVKLSSDFLMNLHLSSATLENTPTFLQLKMPIVVIGGGLTAIDVATESFVYYIKMVAKVAKQYSMLKNELQQAFKSSLSSNDLETFEEYLKHNKLFENKKQKARLLEQKPNFKKIMDELGGVKVVYRKDIKSSPSYKLNYNELNYALREGIDIICKLEPFSFNKKEEDLSSITFKDTNGKMHEFKAKTAILALGNTSNKSNKSENVKFSYSKHSYLEPLQGYEFIASYYEDIAISFFGDMHGKYKGSVVNAMASAKKGSLEINELLEGKTSTNACSLQEIVSKLKAKVVSVKELTEDVFEITVNSKIAAKNFKAGQFFKLQAYNNVNTKVQGFTFNMEPIALTGAKVNKQTGDIVLYAIKAGVSTSLVKQLKKGEEVVLMGPNGKNLNLPSLKNVLLVGGGLGNAVLLSIAEELKNKGNKVAIIAGYKKQNQIFAKEDLIKNADYTLFCAEDLECSNKDQNLFKGNVVNAISGLEDFTNSFKKSSIDYVIVIGSSPMMEAVASYVSKNKGNIFKENIVVKCELNSLMSCMMKEVCGSCVQKINRNGNIEYVYACSSHCHDADDIDFSFLNSRLKQNNLLERLANILLNN